MYGLHKSNRTCFFVITHTHTRASSASDGIRITAIHFRRPPFPTPILLVHAKKGQK